MMDTAKSMTMSDKALDEPQSVSDEIAEGQVGSYSSPKPSLLHRFNEWIKLKPSEVQSVHGKWSNVDLDPVPPEKQTWRSHHFITYWLCDAVAPGNLRLGSSIMTLGFSWRETISIIFLGHFLIALAITANAIIGSKYHIPYTIQSRTSFGFFAAFAAVFVRMLVGFFWYGINTYNGALCVNAVILAIWPSFRDVPNGLGESANITTQMMTAYVVYFLITLPFHYIHPRYLKWFFDAKTVICLPGVFALLGWACHQSKGGLHTTLFLQRTSLRGAEYSWAFLGALNSMLGNYGTMAVNINDFARYARATRMVYVQILAVPLSFMLMSFMGIIIAGAASDLYGVEIWDPLTIMAYWSGSSGARAAAAFVSLSFVLAQLGANISANCISASNDLNAMFPSYVNLRRGSYIIAFIGAWALTPWNILASASALLNFMDGYIIWLAPITGVLLADYYVVHRQTYDVAEMYKPDGKYRYNRWGTNWRAVAAWLVGSVPLIPGFALRMNSGLAISAGADHLYSLGYIYGFLSSFVVFSALGIFFPARTTFAYDGKVDGGIEAVERGGTP